MKTSGATKEKLALVIFNGWQLEKELYTHRCLPLLMRIQLVFNFGSIYRAKWKWLILPTNNTQMIKSKDTFKIMCKSKSYQVNGKENKDLSLQGLLHTILMLKFYQEEHLNYLFQGNGILSYSHIQDRFSIKKRQLFKKIIVVYLKRIKIMKLYTNLKVKKVHLLYWLEESL